MEAIIGDTFAKNAETGTSRSCSFDSFDEDINIHSVHQLCNDSRKKAIHQYIEDSVGGFKYDDSMLIPQISYNKLENVRFNIDKFYNDKLDFIEYGSSSFNTSHYLYRHSDGNVYNVITTRRHTPVIIYDETNKNDTCEMTNIFIASKTYIRNSFYVNMNCYENDTGLSYYPGGWSLMGDTS